jgi:hypothetical protein
VVETLGRGLEGFEVVAPKGVEERPEPADPVDVDPVEAAVGVDPDVDQAGIAEDPEMLAGRGA